VEAHENVVMTEDAHRVALTPSTLRHLASLGLAGAPLATFLALLAHMDGSGFARVTQPQLCEVLGTSAGRVWQSLRALVAAGVIQPPLVTSGGGRRAPYRIPASVAILTEP
jgi:hypothetical protein